MQTINLYIQLLYQRIWSWPLLSLFLVAGIFISFKTNFVQFRYFFRSLKLIFTSSENRKQSADVTQFQSTMTILAGTIGVGCMSGVAIALKISGPGCIFWMWVVCFISMPLKFFEAVLANDFRIQSHDQASSGGPMYYLKNGLNAPILASVFAVFLVLASFGMGNMMQVSSVTQACSCLFSIKPLVSAGLLLVVMALIVFGGIKRIAKVLGFLVPSMMILYLLALLCVIFKNYQQIPSAINTIFQSALCPSSALTGTFFAIMLKTIQFGASQALLTSEAGLGSSSIASCVSNSNSSFNQGLISMACGFITTCVICSLSALAYITSDALNPSLNLHDVDIAIHAFSTIGPGFGFVVFVIMIPFAFSTMLSWIYYGQKGVEYLFGLKYIKAYAFIYAFLMFVPAFIKIDLVYYLSCTCNALMSIPNLIGLIFLAPLLKKAFTKAKYI